jgi:type IV pilus assembly protein PilB
MKKKLGEMLVESGILTQEQLDLALENQKRTDMRLGQFLVNGGGISESDLASIISRQQRIERYDPELHPVDESLKSLIPMDFARKHQLAPIHRADGLLTVAMVDPMDIKALDAVETESNLEVEAIICAEGELNLLINSLYGSDFGISGILGDMNEMSFQRADEDEMSGEIAAQDLDMSSLQSLAEGAPVVRFVNNLISQAVREGASDIHISPEKEGLQIRFRLDGKLHNVPGPARGMILPIVSRIKILGNMDISKFRNPQDGRFSVRMNGKEINVRVSSIPTIYGENLVLRLLDTSAGIYDLRHLGITDFDRAKLEEVMHKSYGMILSTGPTGSGKTTTLYSILKQINQPDINIITLEDPVEYRIENIRQTQLNPKAGMSFKNGIRSILRQDPDVIMIGEIRDDETAGVAIQAALTGHRVLSTIHTNNSAGAITRLLDMHIDAFLIGSVLLSSIAQRLVRKVCPYCKQPYRPPQSALDYWGISDRAEDANFMEAKGCFNCMNTGYKGRTGVFEVLSIDERIQNMILEEKSAHAITKAARESGQLKTLKDNAAEKILNGITTIDEAISAIMV